MSLNGYNMALWLSNFNLKLKNEHKHRSYQDYDSQVVLHKPESPRNCLEFCTLLCIASQPCLTNFSNIPMAEKILIILWFMFSLLFAIDSWRRGLVDQKGQKFTHYSWIIPPLPPKESL